MRPHASHPTTRRSLAMPRTVLNRETVTLTQARFLSQHRVFEPDDVRAVHEQSRSLSVLRHRLHSSQHVMSGAALGRIWRE
jgi:hypothetical protein